MHRRTRDDKGCCPLCATGKRQGSVEMREMPTGYVGFTNVTDQTRWSGSIRRSKNVRVKDGDDDDGRFADGFTSGEQKRNGRKLRGIWRFVAVDVNKHFTDDRSGKPAAPPSDAPDHRIVRNTAND